MPDNNKDNDFAPINVEISDRISTAPPRTKTASSTSNATVKSNNAFVSIVLLVAIAACAGCGYLFMQLNLDKQSLVNAETRIKTLEDRLSATGEEMGNSTVALQVKVGELSEKSEELWSQMDKLWASAWRKNQQEIKTLDGALKGLQQESLSAIKEAESKVSQNASALASIQNRLQAIGTELSTQANEILAINVKHDDFATNAQKRANEVRQISEKLILLEKRNTNLLKQIQEIETKLEASINKSV